MADSYYRYDTLTNSRRWEFRSPTNRTITLVINDGAAVGVVPAVSKEATLYVAAKDAKFPKLADYSCDGINDEKEIQAAIDALPAAGGRVVLSDGTFVLSGVVTMNKAGIVEGQGRGTRVQQTANSDFFNITVDNVAVRHMYLDGSTLPASPTLGTGVKVGTSADQVVVEGITAEQTYHGVAVAGTNVRVANCTVINPKDDGVAVEGTAEDVSIFGNALIGITGVLTTTGSGVEINDGAKRIAVLGNVIDGAVVGVEVHVHASQPPCKHITIASNTIYNTKLAAVRVDDFSTGIRQSHMVIANNIIQEGGEGGTGVRGAIHVKLTDELTIANNNILGTTTADGNVHGILLNSVSHGVLSGNVVTKAQGHGIFIQSSSWLEITGNVVSNGNQSGAGGSGIRATSTTDVTVIGNIIIDDQSTKTQQWGILANTSSDRWTVLGNRFSGNTSGQVSLTGTNIVRGNAGYVTENSGTATITAGQTSVNVSHGLAAAPTRVHLTPTTDTGGKRFWVSAKGSSTFTITIDSTHTADISFDWRAIVGEGN